MRKKNPWGKRSPDIKTVITIITITLKQYPETHGLRDLSRDGNVNAT